MSPVATLALVWNMSLSNDTHARPFSIDLSLELERQLDMESLPPTPAHYATTMPVQSPPAISQLKESLDPDVLAHIITQLRRSLNDLTKERDDLVQLLSSAHAREAELEDALQHMTEKATTMEEDEIVTSYGEFQEPEYDDDGNFLSEGDFDFCTETEEDYVSEDFLASDHDSNEDSFIMSPI